MNRLVTWVRAHRDATSIVVLSAIVVGAVLRVAGVAWGLPQTLHPDEGVIVNTAIDMAKRHSFEPWDFHRPDHVEIKLSYLAYVVYARLFAGDSVGAAFDENAGAFYVISRLITAAFGVASIVLAYYIGKRFARPVGAIAAVLFALFPVLVQHAHYATPDVPFTAVLMVTMLACMHYLEKPGYPALLIACASISTAIAIKYPGALATVMIAIVVIFCAVRDRQWLRIVKHGALAMLAVVVFLFVISPSLFTNASAVVAAIKAEQNASHQGAEGYGFFGNAQFYVTFFHVSAGLVISACVILGIVAAIRLRLVQSIPITLGFMFFIVLSALEFRWSRWGLPMFASALLFAAIGAYFTWRFFGRYRERAPWLRWVIIAIAAVSVANLLVSSVAVVGRFLVTDTRSSMLPALEAAGITPDNTFVEGYSPFRPGVGQRLFDEFETVDGQLVPVEAGRDYVMLSSCTYDAYLWNPKYVDQQAFYAEVMSWEAVESVTYVRAARESAVEPVNIVRATEVIAAFLSGGQNGCDVTVYRIPASVPEPISG